MKSPAQASAASRFGVAERMADGRIRVRFERHLDHPVTRVWSALTDPKELVRWFPEVTLEPRPAGRFRIEFGSRDHADCDGPGVVSGEIMHFEPPWLLQCGTMRWELASSGAGCLLRFSDVVEVSGSRGDHDTAKSVLGGWHWYLDALEQALEGRQVDRAAPEPEYSGRLL